MSKAVASILKGKGAEVWSITPDATAYEALELIALRNVEVLPVASDDILVGILSERDYARQVILLDRSSRVTKASNIMTSDVRTITSDVSVYSRRG